MTDIALVNNKTGKRYRVLKFDPGAGKITLVGEHNVEFTESYDKELFQRLGYELVAA